MASCYNCGVSGASHRRYVHTGYSFGNWVSKRSMLGWFSSLIAILCLTTLAFGQKFMIVNGDTLPYKARMVIQTDTIYLGSKVYYPGDTLYEGTCRTFERIDGKIVNQSNDHCLPIGLWVIKDSTGNYWKGIYEGARGTAFGNSSIRTTDSLQKWKVFPLVKSLIPSRKLNGNAAYTNRWWQCDLTKKYASKNGRQFSNKISDRDNRTASGQIGL